MSKEAMRAEADRLIKEAMERKAVTVKQGDTRIEATCGKCGAKNRVSAAPGRLRLEAWRRVWRRAVVRSPW
jgi:hypothetical protein